MPMQSKASQRSRFYARIGTRGWRDSGYDTFAYRSPAFRQWMRSLLPQRQAILSVGCGAGELEGELSAAGCAVVGLDLSFAMLRRAGRNGLDLPVQADAARLPFGPRRFDIAMFIESIGYLDLDAVFAEARRVLKPEGRLIVTSYSAQINAHARYRKWPVDQVMACAATAGFAVDRCHYLTVAKNRVAEARSPGQSKLFCLSATARGGNSGHALAGERTLDDAKQPGAHWDWRLA
jgi:SAM-dependent methyltransferase